MPDSPSSSPPWRTALMSVPLMFIVLGLAVLFGPVFWKLAHTVWNTDEQGHGPIILAVVAWLFWQRRDRLAAAAMQSRPAGLPAWAIVLSALALYLASRVLNLLTFEMGSMILLLVGVLAGVYGWPVVKVAAFPLLFMLFAVPLPGPLVDVVTQPLKQGVSWVAEHLLYAVGYPIARTGVVLKIGQYQLLVADACAGLNSMFTLEALGLLYMNIIGHTSKLRNVLLAVLVIPMAFLANVIRVIVLVLVTYHFGDEAGQGVVHGMAGMVLFAVAMVLMFMLDGALGLIFRQRRATA